jgi:pyrroloquinoline quinone (PQQ) biosynthesis protein C
LLRYIRWLAGNYVFAGQTPGLFRRGAERFDAAGRRDLAEFARQKAVEESGHAELAYRDLEALGLPAAKVVRLVAPPSAQAFAERFEANVESSEPIALFGFSYCLERMAVERDGAFIRKVEAVCPPGSRALRFLKVHSTIGSDSGHVHEQLSVFESFTNSELTTVTRAAYETAEMLAQQPLMDQTLSDEEISRRLRLAGVLVALPAANTTGNHREAAI